MVFDLGLGRTIHVPFAMYADRPVPGEIPFKGLVAVGIPLGPVPLPFSFVPVLLLDDVTALRPVEPLSVLLSPVIISRDQLAAVGVHFFVRTVSLLTAIDIDHPVVLGGG